MIQMPPVFSSGVKSGGSQFFFWAGLTVPAVVVRMEDARVADFLSQLLHGCIGLTLRSELDTPDATVVTRQLDQPAPADEIHPH